jgi:uncharacterized protein (TIGR03000 family)
LPSCFYSYAPAPYYVYPAPVFYGSGLEAAELPFLLSTTRALESRSTVLSRASVAPPRTPALPPAQATVVVQLPADAKLTANGRLLTTAAERRVFATPDLEPGKSFQYTFTAEVVRDGKPLSMTKRVLVRAGEEAQLQFDLPPAIASRK